MTNPDQSSILPIIQQPTKGSEDDCVDSEDEEAHAQEGTCQIGNQKGKDKMKFKVYWTAEGLKSASLLGGIATINASDGGQAITNARMDIRTQEWSEFKVVGVKESPDMETDGAMRRWDVKFKVKGKHGRFEGTAQPWARTKTSAANKTTRDFKKGGILDDGAYVSVWLV